VVVVVVVVAGEVGGSRCRTSASNISSNSSNINSLISISYPF